jgi:putative ABC transport system permease protein
MMRSFLRLLNVDHGIDTSNVLTLGVPVTIGRFPDASRLNGYLREREFQDRDPIGERLLIQQIVPGKTELGPEIAWEIVGVVHDERLFGIGDEQSTGVYVSNEQSPVYFQTLNVRTSLDPLTIQQSIIAAIHRVDKDQALIDVRTVEQIKNLSMASNRLQSVLLGIFAAVALVLATIGIYGVTAYSAAQRTHEIGIRAALGATARNLLQLVLGRGLILTLVGLAIGAAGSAALTRLMASLLYGVGARDPATMLVVALVLTSVAIVACYIPARRATKIDPLAALRTD